MTLAAIGMFMAAAAILALATMLLPPLIWSEVFRSRAAELLADLDDRIKAGELPEDPYLLRVRGLIDSTVDHPSDISWRSLVPALRASRRTVPDDFDLAEDRFRASASAPERYIASGIIDRFVRLTVRQSVRNTILWAPIWIWFAFRKMGRGVNVSTVAKAVDVTAGSTARQGGGRAALSRA